MKKIVFALTTIMALTLSTSAIAQKQKSIVDIAVGNENFSTLVAALQAADLVEALQGDGPFTVFAPTNDAFAKIDSKTLNSLLEPKNKSTLTAILTYHVVAGDLDSGAVVAALKKGNGMTTVETLSGEKLTVVQKKGKIWLKDASGNYSEIVKTDIEASNGVIHVIGDVVMPK